MLFTKFVPISTMNEGSKEQIKDYTLNKHVTFPTVVLLGDSQCRGHWISGPFFFYIYGRVIIATLSLYVAANELSPYSKHTKSKIKSVS